MARRSRWLGRVGAACAGLGVAGLGAAGCSSDPGPGAKDGAAPQAGTIDFARVSDGPSSQPGLRMASWTTKADEARLAAVLHRYTDAAVLPRAAVDRWRRAGLRVLAVPVADVPGLREELGSVSGVQQQFLGEMSAWNALLQGPQLAATRLDDGEASVAVNAGSLRLLARGWVRARPALGDGTARAGAADAELFVELVPQHRGRADPLSRVGLDPTEAGLRRDEIAEGLVFRDLVFSVALPRDVALLIVPADPSSDWTAMATTPMTDAADASVSTEPAGPRPGPPAGTTDDASVGAVGETIAAGPGIAVFGAGVRGPVGPVTPEGTPVGFGLLTRDAGAAALGDEPRGVIVLSPELPGRFSLLQ